MQKHFVTFYSPGTFVAETTTKPIHDFDISEAIKMSKEIKERHGATPYGFQFTTRERNDDELDSHETSRSNMYYLGGDILTIKDLRKLNNPDDKILIENMKSNGWKRVIRNNNSWQWTQPFNKGDKVLNIQK